ncbi:MAG: hypothetical protein EOO17_03085 [Chloroflexi bacterium]|nr:MAG: hypothetical protein EOO17_03085 [Chloroflexota bacterium]
MRYELVGKSNDVREGIDRQADKTCAYLAGPAIMLAFSDAPEFEKALVLNETHANLHAAGKRSPVIETLSLRALSAAYPSVEDSVIDGLNRDALKVRINAIYESTTADRTFLEAINREVRLAELAGELTMSPTEAERRSNNIIRDTPRNDELEKVLLTKVRQAKITKTVDTEQDQSGVYNPFAEEDGEIEPNTPLMIADKKAA